MQKSSLIYVAGHKGLVGSAIVRILQKEGYNNLLLASSKELDLRNQQSVDDFFALKKPEYVFLAAAKVGGILANSTHQADFTRDNLFIQTNVITSAHLHGVKKLLFLGSSCIYPKHAPQPIKEEYLLTGALEPTNIGYAIAKISGIILGQAYREQYNFDVISAMPTNLYGTGDNFHPENSHVIPGLIQKFHSAVLNNKPNVTIWGTGTPKREFLHVDDMASACLHLMLHYSDSPHVNVGCGSDISILDLAKLIAKVTGFKGEILTDISKPDGTMLKCMDSSKLLNSGWAPNINLEEGLKSTYKWFLDNYTEIRQ